MIEWLTGTSKVQPPSSWDAKGVFSFTAEVMGWNKTYVDQKIEKLVGKDNLELIKDIKEAVSIAMTKGWEGLWDRYVNSYVGDIAKTAANEMADWLKKQVIIKAVLKLASMFNPVAALLQAVMTGWRIYFIRDQFTKLIALVQTLHQRHERNRSGLTRRRHQQS